MSMREEGGTWIRLMGESVTASKERLGSTSPLVSSSGC